MTGQSIESAVMLETYLRKHNRQLYQPNIKKIFHQLMPFWNKKFYYGNGIRWIIQDERKRTPYCVFCGNYANGIGIVTLAKNKFNLPMCKTHICSYLDNHFNQWELTAPFAVKIKLLHQSMESFNSSKHKCFYPNCTCERTPCDKN